MRKLILACLCGLFFVSQCFADGGLIYDSQTSVTQNISLTNNSSEDYGIVGVKTIFITTRVRDEIVTTNRTILRYDIDGRVSEDMIVTITTGRGIHRRRERRHDLYRYDTEGRIVWQLTDVFTYERIGGREEPVLTSREETIYNDQPDPYFPLDLYDPLDHLRYPLGIHASALGPNDYYSAKINIPVEYGSRRVVTTKIAKIRDGAPEDVIAEFNNVFNITGRSTNR